MNRKILVLAASSLVFTSAAFGHSKGTHKGHVSHKSVGACDDKCDDLRRQIDELNASYQERLQALETQVEDLNEVAHDHETLLLDPAEDSWTLGFDVWWPDFTGGEQDLAALSTLGGGIPLISGPVLRTVASDDTAWSASLKFQVEEDIAWGVRYTDADSNTGYGPAVAPGIIAGTFLFNPGVVAAGGFGAIGNAFTSVTGTRDVDVDDLVFEKEGRVWGVEKFVMNYTWGARLAEVDDRQSATFVNTDAAAGAAPDIVTVTTRSTFQGFGPTAGLNGRYYWSENFELQGGFSLAALVGDSDASAVVNESLDAGVTSFNTLDVGGSNDEVNTVLDLGGRFVWHAGDSLDLHVGYHVTKYFDALTTTNSAGRVQDDLNLEGIRAGLAWNFD